MAGFNRRDLTRGLFVTSLDAPAAARAELGTNPPIDTLTTVKAFGAVGNGAHDDTVAIQRAATETRSVLFPPGDYVVSRAIDLRGLTGLVFRGFGRVTIRSSNYAQPILKLGGHFQDIGGFYLTYAEASKLTDRSNAIEFHQFRRSTLSRVYINTCTRGLFIDQAPAKDMPDLIPDANVIFSNTINNIIISDFSVAALDLRSVGVASTGNVFSNIYIHNNPRGQPRFAQNYVIMRGFTENVFNQLNIEHGRCGDAIRLKADCNNIVMNGLHFENVELQGKGSALVRMEEPGAGVFSGVFIQYLRTAEAAIAANYVDVFSFGDGVRIRVNGLWEWGSKLGAARCRLARFFGDNPRGSSISVGEANVKVLLSEVFASSGEPASGVPLRWQDEDMRDGSRSLRLLTGEDEVVDAGDAGTLMLERPLHADRTLRIDPSSTTKMSPRIRVVRSRESSGKGLLRVSDVVALKSGEWCDLQFADGRTLISARGIL